MTPADAGGGSPGSQGTAYVITLRQSPRQRRRFILYRRVSGDLQIAPGVSLWTAMTFPSNERAASAAASRVSCPAANLRLDQLTPGCELHHLAMCVTHRQVILLGVISITLNHTRGRDFGELQRENPEARVSL